MILHEQIDRISGGVSFSPCTFCLKKIHFDRNVRIDKVQFSLWSIYGEQIQLITRGFIFSSLNDLPNEIIAEGSVSETAESNIYEVTFNKELKAGDYWIGIKNDGSFPIHWCICSGSAEIVRGNKEYWAKDNYSLYIRIFGEEIKIPIIQAIPYFAIIGIIIGFLLYKK